VIDKRWQVAKTLLHCIFSNKCANCTAKLASTFIYDHSITNFDRT